MNAQTALGGNTSLMGGPQKARKPRVAYALQEPKPTLRCALHRAMNARTARTIQQRNRQHASAARQGAMVWMAQH
jgi:hypothetical protein